MLAVLYVVGIADTNYIEKHSRLSAYDKIDFELLCEMVGNSSGIIFSPNVLSETSNLMRQKIWGPVLEKVNVAFKEIIRKSNEKYMESRNAVDMLEFARLGLSDAVNLMLHEGGSTLVTDDLDLYLAAAKISDRAINFNHVREARRTDLG